MEEYLDQIRRISPVLSVLGSVDDTVKLIKRGYSSHPLALLLPLLIMNIIPPLIANCSYPRHEITRDGLLYLILGLILGIYFRANERLIGVLGHLGILGKFTSAYDLVHSHERTYRLISWLFIKAIVSIAVRKTIYRKKTTLRKSEFIDFTLNLSVLTIVREYKLPYYYLVAASLTVPFINKAMALLSFTDSDQDDDIVVDFKRINIVTDDDDQRENMNNQRADVTSQSSTESFKSRKSRKSSSPELGESKIKKSGLSSSTKRKRKTN